MATQSNITPDLSRLLNPRGVAIIGASTDLTRIGGQPIKLLTEYGYKGKVYPVNPKYETLCGLQAYASVGSLPEAPGLAIICTPAATVPGIVRQLGEAGTRAAIILSAGLNDDKDKDAHLTRDEVSQGFTRWFDSWNTDKSGVLTDEQLRDGINQEFMPQRPLRGNDQ